MGTIFIRTHVFCRCPTIKQHTRMPNYLPVFVLYSTSVTNWVPFEGISQICASSQADLIFNQELQYNTCAV